MVIYGDVLIIFNLYINYFLVRGAALLLRRELSGKRCLLAAAVLGGKRGTLAVLVYLALGMAGVPVFAGFQGGMGCLLGSTGGYLIGFLFLALVMWAGERLSGGRRWALALSMALGLLVCYAFGTAWFMAVYARTTGQIGLWTALSWCVFPFVLPDAAKLALALVLSRRLAAAVRLR